MELKPFKEMIALSKEKLDEAMAPIRARQVKSKAELLLATIDSNILAKTTRVQELCTDKDFNLDQVLDILDDISILEHRREQCEKVIKQLFPE